MQFYEQQDMDKHPLIAWKVNEKLALESEYQLLWSSLFMSLILKWYKLAELF